MQSVGFHQCLSSICIFSMNLTFVDTFKQVPCIYKHDATMRQEKNAIFSIVFFVYKNSNSNFFAGAECECLSNDRPIIMHFIILLRRKQNNIIITWLIYESKTLRDSNFVQTKLVFIIIFVHIERSLTERTMNDDRRTLYVAVASLCRLNIKITVFDFPC